MLNLEDFIRLSNFQAITDEELKQIVRNFELQLCNGCVIDNTTIIAADLAKTELEKRSKC